MKVLFSPEKGKVRSNVGEHVALEFEFIIIRFVMHALPSLRPSITELRDKTPSFRQHRAKKAL